MWILGSARLLSWNDLGVYLQTVGKIEVFIKFIVIVILVTTNASSRHHHHHCRRYHHLLYNNVHFKPPSWGRWSSGKTRASGSRGPGFNTDHRVFLGMELIPHVPHLTQV